MKLATLTQRFILWFALLTLLPLMLVGYVLVHTFESEFRLSVSREISGIADKKIDQIDTYVAELKRDVLEHAWTKETRQAMLEYAATFAREGSNSAAYQRLQQRYRDHFGRLVGHAGYYDMFLIAKNGDVVYSYKHEADFGSNVFSGTYRNSGLAGVARHALLMLESNMSEFELYAPSNDAVAAFVAAPVMLDGKVAGMLAVQIDSSRVFQVVLDHTGMGESGETVVARRVAEDSALVLVPLREQPQAALKFTLPLQMQDRSQPLVRALNGERGSGVEIDYSGREVLAAWRYLPALHAGIVVKIDSAEILAPMYRVRNLSMLALLVTLLLAVAIAVWLARRVVLPLRQINRGAQDVAAGSFALRLPVARKDEIGQLADSFNRMAESVQASYRNLEQKVAERTAELGKSVTELKVKESAIETSLNAVAMAGLDGKLFYVNQAFVNLWRLPGKEAAIGRSPLEFWEQPEEAQRVVDALVRQGYWRGEMRALLYDGTIADVELFGNRIDDSSCQPYCIMGAFIDITARKQAEHAMEQARDQLAATLAAIPDLLFELDLEGTYYDIHAQNSDMLAAPAESLQGKRVMDMLPRAAAETVLAALHEANSKGISHGRQIELDTPAGKLWFELSVSRKKSGNELKPHFIVLSREITERKRMEVAVMESAEKMNKAQHIAQVGSWELNLLTGKLSWSDEIFNLFEIDKARFAATYEAFLNAIHPADREQVNRAYTQSLQDRQAYLVQHRLLMPDGRVKWVEERGESTFAEDGTPLASHGTVQDITRQKNAEDRLLETEIRYQSVVASLSEGIVLNAGDGTIIDANQSAQRILGLSLEQLLGRKPVDPRWHTMREDGSALPAEEHPAAVTLRTGQAQYDVIMGVQRPDDSVVWIAVTTLPIFQPGDGDTPSLVVASFVDITDRRRAETLLRKSNEELEQRVQQRTAMLSRAKEEAENANLSKSVFLTSMSHELRTPLNAILGYAQLMEMDGGLSPLMVENAQEIRRAGNYLLNLMNDILDLSRIESGKLQLNLEPIRLNEVIEECGRHNLQAAAHKRIALNFASSCSQFRLLADRRALLQILNNLVSNAIKYNRDGGRVSVSCTEQMHGRVKISVMDTGTGIPADKHAQLFQAFNRVGAEMSNVEGTGIGLVISKKLVEAMHGLIGVESVHGLGSTFWVELPMLPVRQPSKPEERRGLHAAGKVPRVLVAEDYAPNQNVLKLQLNTLGCEVEIAPDGAEALLLLRNNQYDLVLADLDMPVMTGVELAAAWRHEEAAGKRLPMVAITASNSASERERCLAAGMDDVLTKPLAMDALRNSLHKWLGEFAGTTATAATGSGMQQAAPVLDLEYLFDILGQVDVERARLLLDTFSTTAGRGLCSMLADPGNRLQVAKEMHKQKSSARTVGAIRYAEMAAQLETQTKDNAFDGIEASLHALQQALQQVVEAAQQELAVARQYKSGDEGKSALPVVNVQSVLVVDDDQVVLQQIRSMLQTLGINEIFTADHGKEANRILLERKNRIEVMICDLSMPEMDGVELIRGFGKTGFNGGIILISGAEEKLIKSVNRLAVLQGVRVLGQLQKPVNLAQLAIMLAHTDDMPQQRGKIANDTEVSKNSIMAAIDRREFSIWFQPVVEASSTRAIGMEALARWQVADGKFVSPENFIRVAEREGLIGELSRLLVSEALQQAAKIQKQGWPLRVSINLSAAWLNDLSLPDFVYAETVAAGLRAAQVIFEVTETGVMEDLATALDVLTRLRLKGFGLSIDDFGIGYSSFEQLGRIPFTEMKLDRSFVSVGNQDAAARAILESSMDMARKLGLSTVAEGVETAEDLSLVRNLGCDFVQGYLFARPMPASEMMAWLSRNVDN